jgi:hypothetical protein
MNTDVFDRFADTTMRTYLVIYIKLVLKISILYTCKRNSFKSDHGVLNVGQIQLSENPSSGR